MREILFRGKLTGNGAWVEGSFWDYLGIPKILTPGNIVCYDVIPETVGQFTGLTDKNGKKIFEGDVIEYITPDNLCAVGEVKFGEYGTGGTIGIGFFVEWHRPRAAGWLRQDIGFWSKCRDIKIIGNIHDNPELLEVEDGN